MRRGSHRHSVLCSGPLRCYHEARLGGWHHVLRHPSSASAAKASQASAWTLCRRSVAPIAITSPYQPPLEVDSIYIYTYHLRLWFGVGHPPKHLRLWFGAGPPTKTRHDSSINKFKSHLIFDRFLGVFFFQASFRDLGTDCFVVDFGAIIQGGLEVAFLKGEAGQ